jgi:class 3 adenylate cyclase
LRNTLAEFFSPKVVKLLADNPELMDGQDAEVSVLYCDIRGFSSVTEKLGPRKAIEWINDVMSELSQCVIDRDGVLVDYVGDELLAMWGAPGAQPDHAKRAIETARSMMAAIDALRKRWGDVLPQRFGAGIGVNTGPARVGNVGSRQKFKYGALGNTVNVGSRLQSATKQFGVDCIVSGESRKGIKPVADCRRLASIFVVGIDQPIEVFELKYSPTDNWKHLAANYELALVDFESKRFGETVRRIGELLQTHPQDRPCKKLLARAVKELDEPSENFSPIWHLPQK